jgi:hypothetical protein
VEAIRLAVEVDESATCTFFGGPEQVPCESGDAEFSGAVDIDDAVRLIAFIFSGSCAPCHVGDDGEPDC